MFEKYPSISPYTYCANNPIILIDPNGEDWFQNELSGEVYFNSKIGKDGAGTGNMEGDGWKWMGDNNMMGTVDNEFVLKYQSLAHEGGGTAGVFSAGNENGFHDGYEMNFGSNSEKFMNEMGYKQVPTQILEYTYSKKMMTGGPGGTRGSVDIGSQIQITEKIGYVSNNYNRVSRKQIGKTLYGRSSFEYVHRLELNYSKGFDLSKVGKGWSAVFGGQLDYKEIGPASINYKLINEFRKYMEIIKDKSIIFVALFFIIVLFENCKVPCTNWERNTMKLHEDFKDGLLEYTTLNSEEMLSHFPIRECDKKYFWSVRYFIPYKTINNYGAYYLEKTFYKEIDSVLSKFTFKSSIV
jgi:hypothetical protein